MYKNIKIIFLLFCFECYLCTESFSVEGTPTHGAVCREYTVLGQNLDYPNDFPKMSREDWLDKLNGTNYFNGSMFKVCSSEAELNYHEIFNKPVIEAGIPTSTNPYLDPNFNKRDVNQVGCSSLITSQSDIVYYVGDKIQVKKVIQFVVDRKNYDMCFKVDTESVLQNGTRVKVTSPQKVVRFISFQEEYGLLKSYLCRTNIRVDHSCRCCCSGIVDNRCDNYRNFCNEDFGSVEWYRCTSRFLAVTGNGCARPDLAGRAVCSQKINWGDTSRVGTVNPTGNRYLIVNSMGTLSTNSNQQISLGASFKAYNATFDVLGSYTYNRYNGGDFLAWESARVLENYNTIDQWDNNKACWVKEDSGTKWQWSEFIDSINYVFSRCCKQWWVPEDLRPDFTAINSYHPTELDKERTLALNLQGYGTAISYANQRFLLDYNYMPSIVMRMELDNVPGIQFSIIYASGVNYKCSGNGTNFTPIKITCTVQSLSSPGLDTIYIKNGDMTLTEQKVNVLKVGDIFNTTTLISTPGSVLLKGCGIDNICNDFLATVIQEGSINTENQTKGNPSDAGNDTGSWLDANIDLNKLFEKYPWVLAIVIIFFVLVVGSILLCVARCTRCFQYCMCCGKNVCKPNKKREKVHVFISKSKEKIQKPFKPKKSDIEQEQYDRLQEEGNESFDNAMSEDTEEDIIASSPKTKRNNIF